MYGYVICEYEKVKEAFPEYETMMRNLETSLRTKAEAQWSPLTYGGMNPTSGQFGKSTILPALFRDITTTQMTTWAQTFTNAHVTAALAGTSQVIIDGRNNSLIPEDYMIGLAGLCFLDKAIKISEIKMQIGDKKIPRINLEECMTYNKPCIVFEQGFTLDEEENFELMGYIMAAGHQRIKLLGLELNRIPNKVQVTNTGAAL